VLGVIGEIYASARHQASAWALFWPNHPHFALFNQALAW
jgi:hypothetical protein